MKRIFIRLHCFPDDSKDLIVCEHIALEDTRTAKKEESPEYTQNLNIACKLCNKTYKFEVYIN